MDNTKTKKKDFNSADAILKNYDFVDRITKQSKYLKEEFQDFGIRIAYKLNDFRHKSLYINLAKQVPRGILEDALQFTLDYPTRDENKGRLFMWRLNQIASEKGIKLPGAGKIRRKKRKSQQLELI